MIPMVVITMKLQFKNNNDFDIFKNDLAERLKEREVRGCDNSGYRRSAVKILIMNKDMKPHVLLTKRSQKVSTHKGQISFPGGGFDEIDGNILNTAFRETFEEVGIPQEDIEFIGQFDDYVSLFGFHISCFIGAIDYPYNYNFNKDEIDDYVEAPLSLFIDQKYDRVEYYNHEGKEYRIFFYNYLNYEIWGLTARILTDFAAKIFAD